jgi:hypothetical protein
MKLISAREDDELKNLKLSGGKRKPPEMSPGACGGKKRRTKSLHLLQLKEYIQ